jgi:hypothetical protein
MIIRPLGLALAGLLLGSAIIGCGNSGESTSPKQKPRETTFRSTRATDPAPDGEKPYLSLRAMEVPRAGQEALQQPKPPGVLKEPEPLPEAAPIGKRRRKIIKQ